MSHRHQWTHHECGKECVIGGFERLEGEFGLIGLSRFRRLRNNPECFRLFCHHRGRDSR
jgi:hypothetical protein